MDDTKVDPRPSRIAVVDDVLTTGAHFKAIKRILKETFDEVEVLGLFLARRVPNTE
jgi:predicted amidophosphoribosyltransferase